VNPLFLKVIVLLLLGGNSLVMLYLWSLRGRKETVEPIPVRIKPARPKPIVRVQKNLLLTPYGGKIPGQYVIVPIGRDGNRDYTRPLIGPASLEDLEPLIPLCIIDRQAADRIARDLISIETSRLVPKPVSGRI